LHSGYCIDRSVSYALDREQIVMPKTIIVGLGGAAAAKPISQADVEAILQKVAAEVREDLDWRIQ
jgi:hypothetical protein